MVGFWYIGRGEAIGVIFPRYPELKICCIEGCEEEELGLEYIGVEGNVCAC